MKLRFLLCLCIVGALAQSDYDEEDGALKEALDPRGHRPVSRGRETYSAGPAAPPPISGGSRYRGRPTVAPVGKLMQEKEEQPDSGGCTHMSEKMGVLCPTGCDLKKTLQKQERNVRPTVEQLKRSVDELTQSTNSVYGYVLDMTAEVTQRQRVSEGNGLVVGQYTDSLETQHAFIKDAVDITFPQNIKILQGVLDKECEDIIRKGGEESQMYLIRPDPLSMPYKVFCDQTSKKGGMSTFIQTHNPNVTQDLKIMRPAEESYEKHPIQAFLQSDITFCNTFKLKCLVSVTESAFSCIQKRLM
uniref:Fibrinogen beta chain n=1 Tax=Cyprinus carpio TaxID=7962 RepID=A0A8C1N1U7_CYPCA